MSMRQALVVGVLLAVVVCVGCQGQDDTLAIVNGKRITVSDAFRQVEPSQRLQAVDSAIFNTLLRAEAEKAGIVVKPEQVQAEAARQFKRMQSQGYTGTLEDFCKARGFSLDEYNEMIELALLQFELGAAQIQYTDANLERFLGENRRMFDEPPLYKVRGILVSNKEKADQIVKRLKAGEKFSAIAKAESLQRDSGAADGYLGELSADDLRVRYAIDPQVLLAQPVGEIVGPLRAATGEQEFWWILINDSRTEPVKATLETHREDIRRAYLQSHQNFESPQELHDRLFKAANIKFVAPGLEMLQERYDELHAKPTPLLLRGPETPAASRRSEPKPADEENPR